MRRTILLMAAAMVCAAGQAAAKSSATGYDFGPYFNEPHPFANTAPNIIWHAPQPAGTPFPTVPFTPVAPIPPYGFVQPAQPGFAPIPPIPPIPPYSAEQPAQPGLGPVVVQSRPATADDGGSFLDNLFDTDFFGTGGPKG